VRAMTRNSENAADLVSDTILLAYQNFEKLKDKSVFKSFVFTIASRRFKRNMRMQKIFGKYDTEYAEQIPAKVTSPDMEIDIKILYKALEKLPLKIKEAVIMFEISGLSLEEIRVIQGGTLSGVKSRLKRGREKLTQMLTEKNDNSEKKVQSDNINDIKINKFPTQGFKNGNSYKHSVYDLQLKVNNDEK
jgi:RNA polymerase sigma-70 factor (ECF subfamily)